MERKYGWKRDLPDMRDFQFLAKWGLPLFDKIDLRPDCPEIVNQGGLGSCTANAINSAYWFTMHKQGVEELFYPSRLFVYYNERRREGNIKQDSGAMIRTGFKVIKKYGVCPEEQWQYIESNFATEPPHECYKHAKLHQAINYSRVEQTMRQLKGCLIMGYPFVFGIALYDSFQTPEVSETGIVPMPTLKEKMLGGHAVMAVGFDDTINSFIVMNSWGKEWGMGGFFLLPYAYAVNPYLACDFWTIQLVEEG